MTVVCRRRNLILCFTLVMLLLPSVVTALSIFPSITKNTSSATQVNIRPAKIPQDLPSIRECRLSDEDIASSASFIKEAFLNAKAMSTGESLGIVAQEKSRPYRVLGTAEVTFYKKSDKAYVRNVYVRQDARGIGLGNQLMEAVEELARDFEFGKVELDVDTNNLPAVSMYRKLGYGTPGIHAVMSSIGNVPGLNVRIRMAKKLS
mmetsp:Transcript_26973/g.41351  ORF Transcript_26973/g.41351 Transcript_26973/m.41351 type:complete len:205 (-) Transcript_26973:29-643(-)